jgi:hypothetical protein
MITWSPARVRLACFAVLVAILTAAVLAGLQGSGSLGAIAYVVIAALALFLPAAITLQVVGGQLLVARLVVGPNDPSLLLLVLAVAGVVATAELLAVVARLDMPLRRDSGDALPRTGYAAAIGGGIFGAVTLLSGLPGPTGLVAVVLASGACLILAIRMSNAAHVRHARDRRSAHG